MDGKGGQERGGENWKGMGWEGREGREGRVMKGEKGRGDEGGKGTGPTRFFRPSGAYGYLLIISAILSTEDLCNFGVDCWKCVPVPPYNYK